MQPSPARLLALAVLLVLPACERAPALGSGGSVAAVTEGPLPGTAATLGVRNAREPLPRLVTAAQPTPEQFDALVAAGYADFVSLRVADEDGAGWEEAHAPERGVAFARIPVDGADGLTREAVDALDRRLEAAGDRPTVLYCGSSNRVGALLALRAAWKEGASPEEALELGRAAGLAGLEPAVVRLLAEGAPATEP